MNWSAEYCVKALEIYDEIGCKNGEAAVYLNLGGVLNLPSLKSSVLLEALAIIKEIGNKEGGATAAYANLEVCLHLTVNIPRLQNITRKLSK